MARFTDRVAIVTGSGRGIGKAVAVGYAAEGGRVVINDIDAEVAEATAQEIRNAGGQAIVCVGSVADRACAEQIVKMAVDTWGTVDGLVNNAGVTRDQLVGRMTDEDWQIVLDVHLKGAFNMFRALSPLFIDKAKANPDALSNGKVVSVSSTAGLRGNIGQINYAAAKAGLLGMTMTMAREWGRYKINVNAVAFGVVETRMTAGVLADQRWTDRVLPQIALGRVAKPEEVTRPVLFLLSDDANYITGECLNVSGGLHMHVGA